MGVGGVLAEVEDDDPALAFDFFVVRRRRREVSVDRELEPGTIGLMTPTLVVFPSPDLVDDERREHGALCEQGALEEVQVHLL